MPSQNVSTDPVTDTPKNPEVDQSNSENTADNGESEVKVSTPEPEKSETTEPETAESPSESSVETEEQSDDSVTTEPEKVEEPTPVTDEVVPTDEVEVAEVPEEEAVVEKEEELKADLGLGEVEVTLSNEEKVALALVEIGKYAQFRGGRVSRNIERHLMGIVDSLKPLDEFKGLFD